MSIQLDRCVWIHGLRDPNCSCLPRANQPRVLIRPSPPHAVSPTAGAVSTSAPPIQVCSIVAAILPRPYRPRRARHHGSRERVRCGEEESGWDDVWWAAFMGFGRSSIPSSQLVTSVGCITLLRCFGWREHPKAFGAFMMERGRGVFAATFDPRTDDASSSFAFPHSPNA